MNTAKFFKKNLKRSMTLIVLFFVTNVCAFLLFLTLFGLSQQGEILYDGVGLQDVVDTFNGTGISRDDLTELLQTYDSFAFRIDAGGNIVDQIGLPEELNHQYSIADVAGFSRWYLDDYPVKTEIADDGSITVLGLPEGSAVRYNIIMPLQNVAWYLLLIPILLLGSLFLFLYLQWSDSVKTRKAVEPILNGIDKLAAGRPVNLPETGPLAQVNEELNEASRKARQREDVRTEWISEVSHDIRTPLAVISGCAEAVENEDNARYCRRIQANVMKLRSLVETLNLNNKLTYGLVPAVFKEESAAGLFRDALIDFINENNMELFPMETDIGTEAEETAVSADRNLIERLVSNLMANSIVHNPDGTRIDVSVHSENGEIVLKIRDSGIGMEEEEVEKLYESNPENYESHGQGLRLAAKIVKVHNGSIRFRSEPGEYFETEARIPVIQKQAAD